MATPGIPSMNVFGDGVLEPLRGAFQFTVAGGGTLAANVTVRAFVDGINQNAAGGLNLVQGDYSLQGGQIPSGVGYEAHGLSCYLHQDTFAAVPSELLVAGLGANVWLQMMYAGNYYNLGLLAEYLGPWGSPTGLNNVDFVRRFGWPWMREQRPLVLEPGKQFWIEATTLRAMTGMPAGNWVTRVVLPTRKVTQGVNAVKQ